MVFTKERQERLLAKYIEEHPNASEGEVQAYMDGVEEGIKVHINYEIEYRYDCARRDFLKHT